MWLVTRLPRTVQIRFGAFLGFLGFLLAARRRRIVAVNLRLCFPDLSARQRHALTRAVFRSAGISLVETAVAWLRDPRDYRSIVTFNGLEHLEEAVREGKGVILLGMHLSTLDFCGAMLATRRNFDVMYRPNKNKVLEMIMTRGREKNFSKAIHRDDVRGVLTRLREGHIVWYGPDQDYGRKHSVFAPFFGVQTATITATARIARISDSPVVVLTHYRSSDDKHYEVNLRAPLDNFPAGDDVRDAAMINRLVEEAIMKCPEQYWWLHRRFKTRPEGEERPY